MRHASEVENREDSEISIFVWAMHISAQRPLPHKITIVLWRNIMTSLLGAAWELLLPSDHLGHLPPDPNEPAENSERMYENLLKSNEFLLQHRCRGSRFQNPGRAQRNALEETTSAMFDLNEEMVSNAKDIQTGRDNAERVHASLLRISDVVAAKELRRARCRGQATARLSVRGRQVDHGARRARLPQTGPIRSANNRQRFGSTHPTITRQQVEKQDGVFLDMLDHGIDLLRPTRVIFRNHCDDNEKQHAAVPNTASTVLTKPSPSSRSVCRHSRSHSMRSSHALPIGTGIVSTREKDRGQLLSSPARGNSSSCVTSSAVIATISSAD
ncbi:hypothetical protein CCHR01_17751 [Colletotrichum chrysophilum]|uniref:Uncharacterized protein n=1 Tax=Colletotrichum chrysophilum TaxID=1836956 RepID=A0AAD9EC70_9PEZI|nr:hypothetical protein CCHR01_17751 [Colletotrichum chrysophilum]